MKKITKLILIGLLALALFLRIYKIGEVPPSLNWDEVAIGYNAYSILQTGHDEWGKSLPLHFKSYGEYKLPGQIYASIPAVFIFGLNPFAVRITPVLYGLVTVFLIYLLAQRLFKDEKIALLSSFFVAVSPWHIQLTRGSFESSFALMWVVLGIYFLVRGFDSAKYWVWSTLPFAFAMYTYNSARAFIPVFLLAILVFYRREVVKNSKKFFAAVIVFAILTFPIALFFLSGQGSARYKLVSVTDDPGLIPRIEEQRNISKLPLLLTNLIHNRYSYVSRTVAKNYLAHFSFDFLFINGAGHRQHHIQSIGQLYIIQAPFLLFGLYLLFKKRNKFAPLLLVWNLTAFIPVAFTLDSIPHALRTLNAMPTYQLVSAFGFFGVISALERKKREALVFSLFGLALFVIQFGNFFNNLFTLYPKIYSRDWQYGNKQVVEFIKDNYANYDLIVYTRHYGEPHMFTLFYLNYDPQRFTTDPKLNRFETYDWVRVLNFDKFYFPDLGDLGTRYEDIVDQNQDKKILFIGKPGDFPESAKLVKEVYFLNGDKAFEIVEK